jgi:hypothetical protein
MVRQGLTLQEAQREAMPHKHAAAIKEEDAARRGMVEPKLYSLNMCAAFMALDAGSRVEHRHYGEAVIAQNRMTWLKPYKPVDVSEATCRDWRIIKEEPKKPELPYLDSEIVMQDGWLGFRDKYNNWRRLHEALSIPEFVGFIDDEGEVYDHARFYNNIGTDDSPASVPRSVRLRKEKPSELMAINKPNKLAQPG